MRRVNGIKHPLNLWPKEVVEVMKQIIPQVRRMLEMMRVPRTELQLLAGRRFKDDDQVMSRVRSWATWEQFMGEPLAWTREALEDCAAADWYYVNEKSYDYDLLEAELENKESV